MHTRSHLARVPPCRHSEDGSVNPYGPHRDHYTWIRQRRGLADLTPKVSSTHPAARREVSRRWRTRRKVCVAGQLQDALSLTPMCSHAAAHRWCSRSRIAATTAATTPAGARLPHDPVILGCAGRTLVVLR